MAENEAAEDASMVLTAITPMRRSVPASVEPVLNPNQPKKSTRQPMMAMGMWCPGIALGVPSLRYFPIRGPSALAPARAETPPTKSTTEEKRKDLGGRRIIK